MHLPRARDLVQHRGVVNDLTPSWQKGASLVYLALNSNIKEFWLEWEGTEVDIGNNYKILTLTI